MKRTPMKRTPMKKRAKKKSLADFTVDTRLTMIERSQGLDEVTGKPLTGWLQAHHRSSRNMGGSRFDATKGYASNGLLISADTHTYIEAHPEEAVEKGWIVRQGYDPEKVPVLLHNGWHYLNANGTTTAADADGLPHNEALPPSGTSSHGA